MTDASLLTPPSELCSTRDDRTAFEDARRCTSLVEFLEAHYALRDVDWGSLFSYFLEHQGAVHVLLEAPAAIQRVFGEVRPLLDLVADPEEGWEELFIVVPTREPAGRALEQLKQLDAEWFAESARQAQFAVNVTVSRDV
ncbi:MAG: hypothetical protein HYV92_15465 [Candidatus Rokubacteria bacterium]|nr:hypothetical protein [Candidatus Rokubacteria bacterium]